MVRLLKIKRIINQGLNLILVVIYIIQVEAVGTAGVNLEKALLDRALAVEQSTVADEVVGGLVEVGEAVVAAVTTAITPALKLLVAVTTMDLAVIPDMRAVMRTVVRVVADILGQLR